MVAAEEVDVVGVLDLQRIEKAQHVNAALAPVDVIAKKEVGVVRRKAVLEEDADQIKELTVDVAHNDDGTFDREDDRLGEEDGADGGAKITGRHQAMSD